MKKLLKLSFILTLSVFTLFFVMNITKAENLSTKLKGKILLQVEQNGEAWYINPSDEQRHFLGRPDDAFKIMRELGVGITNADLEKIPMSLDILSGPDSDGDGLPDIFEDAIGTDKNNKDTDGDAYDDKTEILGGFDPKKGNGARLPIDFKFAEKQKGKILLQVENNGEAWYVNPTNNKRYFLGRPVDAFNVMRGLGLGISDDNLEKIKTTKEGTPELACDSFPDKLESCEPFSCKFIHPLTGEPTEREIIGLVGDTCHYTEEMPNNGRMDCEYTESSRKAVAQYHRDINNSESFGTSIKGNLSGGTMKIISTIDGKEVENPLLEVLDNGQCIISGYDNSFSDNDGNTKQDNSLSNNSDDIEIELGDFIITKNAFDKDAWKMDIKITNNSSDKALLDLLGTGRENNWIWGISTSLDSGGSETFNLTIDHLFFDETTFGKKELIFSIYECDKLSKLNKDELCGSETYFWEILERKKYTGDPIKPSTIFKKYFNHSSFELPPSEISEEEYLK